MSPQVGNEEMLPPLTGSQSLIWMSQQLSPDSPLFNMAHRFDLAGEIEPEKFTRALQAVVDASDALRTVFVKSEQGVTQQVLRQLQVDVDVIDFSSEHGPEQSTTAWMQERARRMLDLSRCAHESALLKLSEGQWVWFMNVHHLIADAWSMSLICAAVGDQYSSGVDVKTSCSLPAFREYRQFESEWRSSQSYRDAEAYWRDSLERPSGLVALYGCKGTRGMTESTRLVLPFGPERAGKFHEFAARPEYRNLSQHLARFNLLATAIFAYLYRVDQSDFITIGTPTHNRPSRGFRETIGLFIETLPFSIGVEAGETFTSLFEKVKTQSQYFLRYAQPGTSNPSLSRRFNVVFNYINVGMGGVGKTVVSSALVSSGSVDSGHDLRIQVHDLNDSGELEISLDVNNSTLSSELREHVGAHLLKVLDAFLANPSLPIGTVDLTSEAEKQRLIAGYNAAFRRSLPAHLLDAFRSVAKGWPDAVAVSCGESKLSYAELNDRAERLARTLAARGCGQEGAVGICLSRSPDLVVSVLAVMMSGSAFVLLESSLPSERLAFIQDDADLNLVLCNSASEERGQAMQQQWLPVEQAICESGQHPALAPPVTRPDSRAYILYTSGSTGFPKGVVVSHAALAAYIYWSHRSFGRNEACDMPLFSAIGFDLTLTSLLIPLVSGGAVTVYPEQGSGADLAVLKVFEDDCVDVVKLTPAHLALVLEQPRRLSRIQTLVLGGENLEVDLATRAQSALGRVEIYNEYGPTEAVVGCMKHRFDPEADLGPSVPIGVPAAHHRIYLLDDGKNPVPAGVAGEIFVAGNGLANGYLNRPEENAQKFIPDPFYDGDTMYRTGDLARFNEQGVLEYLGRLDEQLKLGGVRLEPAEVTRAVTSFPGIGECVVDVIAPEPAVALEEIHYCTRCGLSSEYPDVSFDASGTCNLCIEFETYRDKAQIYFGGTEQLQDLLNEAGHRRKGAYDCIMLLSGGKDSTYALYRVAELKPRILALTLDNGFISEDAKSNIRRVVESIGVDHRFITNSAMNEIFSDSLKRHSNVCQGCFKAIYTLAVNIAIDEGIPFIVTGLSRGQFFETRLTPELFRSRDTDLATVEATILEARKAYHGVDDAVSRCMDVAVFSDEHVFDKVGFIDFYRYCDVSLDEVYRYLAERAPWIRPRDTGRSTNCLINDAGIYVHKRKEGYHNYALPYSWDVRMGHKTRDAALDELNDDIDVVRVYDMLEKIGYEEDAFNAGRDRSRMVVYYTASKPIDEAALRAHVAQYLHESAVPSIYVEIDKIPLTGNGKVDRTALPAPQLGRPAVKTPYLAPRDKIETAIAEIWRDVLDIRRVGIADNYYALGGDSIAAIQIAARANERRLPIAAVDVFEHQTVESLARHVSAGVVERDASADESAGGMEDPARFSMANLDDALMSRVEDLLSRSSE